MTARISIIIPAWREEKVLAQTLQSLDHMDYAPGEYEVIVVAGGDETIQVAEEESMGKPWMRVIPQKQDSGKNQAIIDGLKESTGELIVLLDADTMVEPSWLTELVKPILDGRFDIVNGVYNPITENWVSRFYLIQRVFLVENRMWRFLHGAASIAFRKSMVDGRETQFLNPTVYRGVDHLLYIKAVEGGFKPGVSENAVVKTRFPTTIKDFLTTESRAADTSIHLMRETDTHDARFILSPLITLSLASTLTLPSLMKIPPLAFLTIFLMKNAYSFIKHFNNQGLRRLLNPLCYIQYMLLNIIAHTIFTISIMKSILSLTRINKHFKGPRP
ncbi:MAG: glycosyltransferase [Candidatus Altiarchaeota archaeon]